MHLHTDYDLSDIFHLLTLFSPILFIFLFSFDLFTLILRNFIVYLVRSTSDETAQLRFLHHHTRLLSLSSEINLFDGCASHTILRRHTNGSCDTAFCRHCTGNDDSSSRFGFFLSFFERLREEKANSRECQMGDRKKKQCCKTKTGVYDFGISLPLRGRYKDNGKMFSLALM